MKLAVDWRKLFGGSALWIAGLAGSAWGAAPTVEQALRLKPVQDDVQFDKPAESETAKCTVKAEKIDGQTGWVVRDAAGQTLRRFIDTNNDNVVDLWSYYDHGVEVYRDVDADFNNKADQYRWLNTGGSRWGLDQNEDGQIDSWKVISAEEVTAEVVAAIARHDANRFSRLMLSADELTDLGIAEPRSKEIKEKIKAAATNFKALSTRQKEVTNKTNWVDFGSSLPGVVPAGELGTKDLVVYENVVAMVETAGKHGQVQIGSLVRVGDVWRMIDVPQILEEGQADLQTTGFFIPSAMANRPESPDGKTAENGGELQSLLAELEKLDEAGQAVPEAGQAKLMSQRADILEKIVLAADTPDDRNQWMRTLADHLSAAVQSGAYPAGVERLKALQEKLAGQQGDEDLAGYTEFRYLTAKYTQDIQDPKGDFSKIQTGWLDRLQKYVEKYPKSPDTSEALLQLAIAEEFAGQEDEAKNWYRKIADDFPTSPSAPKAVGAIARLDCVGKELKLKGASPNGKVVDVAQFRKKVVVVHYWATNCEPCKAEFAQLKELQAKFGKDLAIVGVNLDSRKEDLDAFLKRTPLPWPQMFEPGGLDSRLANEMGVLTLPMALLLDQQGKVVNRNIHVTELDKEVRALLK